MSVRFGSDISMRKGIYTFLNPYSYYVLRKEIKTLYSFDEVYCDGILFVWLVRLLGIKVKRVSFDMTSLAPIVFSWAEKNALTIAFVGGEKGIVEKAIKNFKNRYPKLQVIYNHSGFFEKEKTREDVILDILSASPDIVIVGMGAGLQERFLLTLHDKGWDGCGYTCGGFLHQSASTEKNYYPYYIDKWNMRWIYRIYKEPKLFKRYFYYYPKSVFAFLLDATNHKLK